MKSSVSRRYAYLYPGVKRFGVGLCVVRDDNIQHIAIGSISGELVAEYLDQFSPERMVVSTENLVDNSLGVPVPDSVKEFWFARPGWSKRSVRFPDREKARRMGRYVSNVWKLLYQELILRDNLRLSHLNVSELTADWIRKHRPGRLSDADRYRQSNSRS